MPIELTNEQREAAVASIRAYSGEHFDEPLGHLAAGLLLDFFLKEIGPCIFNRAVKDVQDHLQPHLMDLDLELHEEEFAYSRSKGFRGS